MPIDDALGTIEEKQDKEENNHNVIRLDNIQNPLLTDNLISVWSNLEEFKEEYFKQYHNYEFKVEDIDDVWKDVRPLWDYHKLITDSIYECVGDLKRWEGVFEGCLNPELIYKPGGETLLAPAAVRQRILDSTDSYFETINNIDIKPSNKKNAKLSNLVKNTNELLDDLTVTDNIAGVIIIGRSVLTNMTQLRDEYNELLGSEKYYYQDHFEKIAKFMKGKDRIGYQIDNYHHRVNLKDPKEKKKPSTPQKKKKKFWNWSR